MFEINEIQQNEWKKKKNSKNFPSTIGGSYEYVFAPNSIGVSLVVKCLGDNTEIDLTDYNSW